MDEKEKEEDKEKEKEEVEVEEKEEVEGKGILEDNEKAVQLWQPPLRKIIELELESSLINRKTMEVKEIVEQCVEKKRRMLSYEEETMKDLLNKVERVEEEEPEGTYDRGKEVEVEVEGEEEGEEEDKSEESETQNNLKKAIEAQEIDQQPELPYQEFLPFWNTSPNQPTHTTDHHKNEGVNYYNELINNQVIYPVEPPTFSQQISTTIFEDDYILTQPIHSPDLQTSVRPRPTQEELRELLRQGLTDEEINSLEHMPEEELQTIYAELRRETMASENAEEIKNVVREFKGHMLRQEYLSEGDWEEGKLEEKYQRQLVEVKEEEDEQQYQQDYQQDYRENYQQEYQQECQQEYEQHQQQPEYHQQYRQPYQLEFHQQQYESHHQQPEEYDNRQYHQQPQSEPQHQKNPEHSQQPSKHSSNFLQHESSEYPYNQKHNQNENQHSLNYLDQNNFEFSFSETPEPESIPTPRFSPQSSPQPEPEWNCHSLLLLPEPELRQQLISYFGQDPDNRIAKMTFKELQKLVEDCINDLQNETNFLTNSQNQQIITTVIQEPQKIVTSELINELSSVKENEENCMVTNLKLTTTLPVLESTEKIRELILLSFPDLAQEIEAMNSRELKEIYEELKIQLEANNPKNNSNNESFKSPKESAKSKPATDLNNREDHKKSKTVTKTYPQTDTKTYPQTNDHNFKKKQFPNKPPIQSPSQPQQDIDIKELKKILMHQLPPNMRSEIIRLDDEEIKAIFEDSMQSGQRTGLSAGKEKNESLKVSKEQVKKGEKGEKGEKNDKNDKNVESEAWEPNLMSRNRKKLIIGEPSSAESSSKHTKDDLLPAKYEKYSKTTFKTRSKLYDLSDYAKKKHRSRTLVLLHTEEDSGSEEGKNEGQQFDNKDKLGKKCTCDCCKNNSLPELFSKLLKMFRGND